MPKFLYIFRGGGYSQPGSVSPGELQQHLAKWTAWTNGLLAAGRLAAAAALEYPGTGKTLRGRDRVVTDGPYAESKDLVSGTLVVEAWSAVCSTSGPAPRAIASRASSRGGHRVRAHTRVLGRRYGLGANRRVL